METASHSRTSVAAVLLVVAGSLAAAAASPVSAQPVGASPAAYGWPVKPFDRQHPVRGNLDDPRIGQRGGTSFHFGIDISVPDGTAVYAVAGGRAYVLPGNVEVTTGTRTFGYWHIRAAVENRALVRRHQLLGWVIAGWEHVHFAESADGVYLNPLREGALGPYADTTAPKVGRISVVRTAAGFEIGAEAYDLPSPRVPGAWRNEPVSPALVRWRIVREGAAVGGWRTAADFRTRMLDRRLFDSVYAPSTRQNHKGRAGTYCYFLSRAWRPTDGSYRIDVAASDTRGNRALGSLELTIDHGRMQP